MQLLTDRETLILIQGAQAHDPDAQTRMYIYLSTPLYRYFVVHTRDPHLAEALHSDLVLRLLEVIRQFQPPASGTAKAFVAWVYCVASRLLADHYRRTKRTSVSLDDVQLEAPSDAGETVERTLDRAALVTAIARLTPEQQRVIRLRFWDGRRTDEVAVLTGQTPGAVKAMQYRALRTLATMLNPADEGAFSSAACS